MFPVSPSNSAVGVEPMKLNPFTVKPQQTGFLKEP